MKRLILLVALLLLVVPAVQAQTATPTTSPVVHSQGEYWFYTDANITYSGVWSDLTLGYITYKSTSVTTAYAAFTVSDSICTLSITTGTNGTLNVDINGSLAKTFSGNAPANASRAVVDTTSYSADFVVKLYLSGGPPLNLFTFQLLECQDNTPVPTATILPSGTPANTPVNTPTEIVFPATPTEIVFPATPTEIVFPATPTEINTPVDTPTEIVFPATPTEINTPVDTPTEINIDPTIAFMLTLIAGGPTPNPNTPTPSYTPSVTNTPTPEPRSCATLPVSGQMACFDYIATASDVHIGNLIALIFFSVWGFFLFSVFVLWRNKK